MWSIALAASAYAGGPLHCDMDAVTIDSVVDSDGYQTSYDLATMGYDPTPLLSKSFKVGSGSSCVVAQISIHTLSGWGFGDEFAALKVTLDGNPMYGHITGCSTNGVNVPCILLDNNARSGSHSYHLVYPGVQPGEHRIDVWWAGVDNNGSPGGAYVGGATLSVHHQ